MKSPLVVTKHLNENMSYRVLDLERTLVIVYLNPQCIAEIHLQHP